jgi:hypothetical protein
MQPLRITSIIFCAGLLTACEAPRTFQDAGVYQGENYEITVDRVPDGILRNFHIALNGERILTIEGSKMALQADDCKKIAFYVSQCTFRTSYRDRPVKVVMDSDARPFQQEVNYSVYMSSTLIGKVTTPML